MTHALDGSRSARGDSVKVGTRRSMRSLTALIVGIALAAAACGSDKKTGTSESTGKNATTTSVDTGKPQRGGEVTIGIAGGFTGWEPDSAQNPPDINII